MKRTLLPTERVIDFFKRGVPVNLVGKLEEYAKKFNLSKTPEERESINDEALAFIEDNSKSFEQSISMTGYYGSWRSYSKP